MLTIRCWLVAAVCVYLANGSICECEEPDFDAPYLGLLFANASAASSVFTELDVPARDGVVILAVDPRGPAAKTLELLDFVTKVNGQEVRDSVEFTRITAALPTGETVVLVGFEASKRTRVVFSPKSFRIKPFSWRQALVASVDTTVDDIGGTPLIEHKDRPHLRTTSLVSYYKRSGETVGPLFFRFQYRAKDWIFAKKVTIRANDKTFEIPVVDHHGDADRGGIVEWWDTVADPNIVDAILTIKSDLPVIRFHGNDFTHDHTLSFSDIDRLLMVSRFRQMDVSGKVSPPGPKEDAADTTRDGPAADLRDFTSSAGTTVKARFSSYGSGTVTLEKEDGTKISVPLDKFSEADQKWIKDEIERRRNR